MSYDLAVWAGAMPSSNAGEDSPWADGPLLGNASGESLVLSLVWSRAEEASDVVARLAAQHGLVCYDPQTEEWRRPEAAARRRRFPWLRRS